MKLINISNHHPDTWSQEQKAGWDEIIHIPFPYVDPHQTSKDLDAVTLCTVNQIKKSSGLLPKVDSRLKTNVWTSTCDCGNTPIWYTPNDIRVCIQGDFSLTVKIIQWLGIGGKLVFPTSQRDSVLNSDGTKTIRFRFVQWREI